MPKKSRYSYSQQKRMKSEIDIYVIQQVRRRREALGFSQETLSYKIGLSTSFIGCVESGKAKYSVKHLNMIAFVLKCSIKDFFPDKAFPIPDIK